MLVLRIVVRWIERLAPSEPATATSVIKIVDIRQRSRPHSLLLFLGRLQDLEGAQEALVHAHHRTSVVELAAVVWRREQGDQLTLAEELIAILHDLVSTAYEVHVVLLQKAGDDVGTEGERDAAIVFAPAGDVLVGIRPEKIAE